MRYRNALPQLDGQVLLTDGGMETDAASSTTGIDLPCFARSRCSSTRTAAQRLRRYFAPYLDVARRHGAGFVVEHRPGARTRTGARSSGTPAASSPRRTGGGRARRGGPRAARSAGPPIVVSGCVGPRGDGYDPASTMSADEAASVPRAGRSASSPTPRPTRSPALTMTYAEEAIGIVRAAAAAGMPAAIVVHGRDRRPAAERASRCARRSSRSTPRPAAGAAYFMVNCAHPTHFAVGARRTGAVAPTRSAACARTRRRRAMPSSTSRRSSTTAIPPSSPPARRAARAPAAADRARRLPAEPATIVEQPCEGSIVVGRSLTHGGRGYYFTSRYAEDDETAASTGQLVASIQFTDG